MTDHHILVIKEGTDPDGDWRDWYVEHPGCPEVKEAWGPHFEYVRIDCPVEWEISNVGYASIREEMENLPPGRYPIEYWFEEVHIPMVGTEYDCGLRFV